jgi:hypothetical protein
LIHLSWSGGIVALFFFLQPGITGMT